jgi:glucokinase
MIGGKATLLVGDIGGTNVRFALARVEDGAVRLGEVWKRPGKARYPGFMDALEDFLSGVGEAVDGAAMGLAGPVGKGPVKLLNAGWTCDPEEVAVRLGGAPVVFVNDFFAMARSAVMTDEAHLIMLSEGEAEPEQNVVVGGPGTGMGLATLRRSQPARADVPAEWIVVGGEGGHQSFNPANETEWGVAEKLRTWGVYPTNEFVAAGAGFRMTLDALADVLGMPRQPGEPEEVTRLANAGEPLADAYFRLRAHTTMSALSDAAVAVNAHGGVFVAGGVAVRLEAWLREPGAVARFRQKGPRTELLSKIPIRLMTDEAAPLKGAAALWLDRERRGWL